MQKAQNEIKTFRNYSSKSLYYRYFLKLMTGIEPVTPSLPRKCSTSEPHQRGIKSLNRLINIIYKRFLVNCFFNFPLPERAKLNLIHAFQNILKFALDSTQCVIDGFFLFSIEILMEDLGNSRHSSRRAGTDWS